MTSVRRDAECIEFLRWALPRLRMRWPGFRKVRRQVCRRARRRARQLGLADLRAYREHLERHPEEWGRLDELTCITISRFYRDRGVFAFLQETVLPSLADGAREAGAGTIEAWSAGCASGEEAYTLAIMWELALAARFPRLGLRVVATDIEPAMLRRARDACYGAGSIRDLPEQWRQPAFVPRGDLLCLRPAFRRPVTVVRHDLRAGPPDGSFDLVLCRNLAFTYFDDQVQREVVARLADCLPPGGALVVGAHERLPGGHPAFAPWSASHGVYRRTAGADHEREEPREASA